MTARIESIQVGRSQSFDSEGDSSKPWSSAIIKHTVEGSVLVGATGIDGDEQADLQHHGGRDKAILASSSAHYPFWTARYAESGFIAGGFGENLTISGMDETTCCIGDVFEIGGCRLEVSQPRQPCWKLSRRWGIPRLAVEVQEERRTGWYLRVLQQGQLQAGVPIVLSERRNPERTVAWALSVMYANPRCSSDDLRLARFPQLSESWKKNLEARATLGLSIDDGKRLKGG